MKCVGYGNTPLTFEINDMFTVDFPSIDYLRLSSQGTANDRLNWFFSALKGVRTDKKIMQYLGQTVNEVFWGHAEMNGRLWGLLDVPGEGADEVAHQTWFMGMGEEAVCKRLDYQLTLPQPEKYDAFELHNSLEKCCHRLVGIQGVREKGMTVSIGNRVTGKYIRIYQKSSREGKYTKWWIRFEVEYTHQMSISAWRNSPLDAVGIVLSELNDIKATGYAKEVLAPFLEIVRNYKSHKIRRVKPTPNTYNWLDATVAPVLYRLINSHDFDDFDFANSWIEEVYYRLQERKARGV